MMMKNVIDNPISNYCETHNGFEVCASAPGMFHVVLFPAFNGNTVSFYQFLANGLIHMRWVILHSMTHRLLPSIHPSAIQIGKHLLNKQTQAVLKNTGTVAMAEGTVCKHRTTHTVHILCFSEKCIIALMKLHSYVCNDNEWCNC